MGSQVTYLSGKPGHPEALATSYPPPVEWEDERKDIAVIALRAGGATYDQIMEHLGISRSKVSSLLKRQENLELMRMIRDVQKVEAVANGLALQRRYLDTLRTMPLDKDHAAAHRNIVAAFATLYDKAAHAAGEATERVESRSIAINIDMKQAMLEQLRESQERVRERELYATTIDG